MGRRPLFPTIDYFNAVAYLTAQQGGAHIGDVAAFVGSPYWVARSYLEELRRDGLLEVVQRFGRPYYRPYRA